MSSPIKIAVAEPSLIIRNGMLSVLKRLSGLNIQIVEIPDVSKLDMILRMHFFLPSDRVLIMIMYFPTR